MSDDSLLPCPFGCGVETRWFETAKEAILAWNRRTPGAVSG